MAKVGENLKSTMDFDRGMATLGAYARGGLKDLQNFFASPCPDSQQQADVLGMAGNPTPAEVDREQGMQRDGR